MSNTMFPMTAAPLTRSLEARGHACLPLGTAAVNPIVNAAVDARPANARIDVPVYGFKQGRPPRGVPR